MWAAGFALFLLGLSFLIAGPISKKKNTRCSEQIQGTLTNIRQNHSSEHGSRNVYYYSYTVDGHEYQLRSTVRSKEANVPGDTCTLWYDPKKPKVAQPFHYASATPYRIILIIGIVMLLVGIVLVLISLGA